MKQPIKENSKTKRKALLTATEACRSLGIKPQTLYAYVSRGLLVPTSTVTRRGSLYLKSDIEMLRARARARSGHGPTAASALRWGDPVLESGISCIQDGMLYYRGFSIAKLAEDHVPFEAVAEMLWSGVLSERPFVWNPASFPTSGATGSFPRSLSTLLAIHAADQDVGEERLDETLVRARSVISGFIETLLRGAKVKGPESLAAVNAALVVCADHELNASTFSARIAASTGADFYACVQAALAAFSGLRHGLSPVEVAQFIASIKSESDIRRITRDHANRGQVLAGFGHQLYPNGDPRATILLTHARTLAAKRGGEFEKSQRLVDLLIDRTSEESDAKPNLDLGLVAVASALGLDRFGASTLFVLGRMAGWTAHILEQRQQDFMLRPRARYIGRRPM